MNAVEIGQALSALIKEPFDKDTFAYVFLECFGNIDTTIDRLKSGDSNKSDLPNGVLQKPHIHMIVCDKGKVPETIKALRKSPATKTQKAKFILATDGEFFHAENVANYKSVICDYLDFPDHSDFFLSLAGIKTNEAIEESILDVRATQRLNELYIALFKHNEDWDTPEYRHEMNHFMIRLIFCFFAEDTEAFVDGNNKIFTETVLTKSQKSPFAPNAPSNTHEVIKEIFRVMDTKEKERYKAKIESWAFKFPYVNGGLFSGQMQVPRFSDKACEHLKGLGGMDWKRINPDIFGSMIQAVADNKERGAVGMHYTSVPNILKVLNPLFLDSLQAGLDNANGDKKKLEALRTRIKQIRVLDPACGSGNFLVIAYKRMRKIEARINELCGERIRKSVIPLNNFRGIELGHFAAEVARLALIIAKYQCDVLYRGQRPSRKEFLPLELDNWITCGNALERNWAELWPQDDRATKHKSDRLFSEAGYNAKIDFKHRGGETYICGNPPYVGSKSQSSKQKEDIKEIFKGHTNKWRTLDYVAGWFMKAAEYNKMTGAKAAFVTTNSICQGEQIPALWPSIFHTGQEIIFSHTSFKWKNLASHNAGVTVVIVGIGKQEKKDKRLFSMDADGETRERQAENINAYLLSAPNVNVQKFSKSICGLPTITLGNGPFDGGHLLMTQSELTRMELPEEVQKKFIRQILGSAEFINGKIRYCLWIKDEDLAEAMKIEPFRKRIEGVRKMRLASPTAATREGANWSHKFLHIHIDGESKKPFLVVPRVSSENRPYLPVGLLPKECLLTDAAFAFYDAPLWTMALLSSRLHLVWITTLCGKLENRIRYSSQLGWNTFPMPEQPLTPANKTDLTRCAENILLAREAHFPATIADLYEVKNGQSKMPDDLATAHRQNDEVLERIYKGRVFKNDTERLETLFEMYTKMTGGK